MAGSMSKNKVSARPVGANNKAKVDQSTTITTPQKTAPESVKPEDKVEVKSKPVESKPAKAQAGATVAFSPGWKQVVQGELAGGSRVTITYDPSRAQLQETHKGAPAWGVQAFAKAMPSGQVVEAPVVDFEAKDRAPKARPFTLDLPKGTVELHVWFKNWTGGDQPREAWDSNFGINYRFPVRP